MLQAFKALPLDLAVDFTNADTRPVRIIKGRGSMVYWKGCNVSVIWKDDEGKEHTTPLKGVPEGQGFLNSGTELYIVNGEVKEG